jgi:hypothetical protein
MNNEHMVVRIVADEPASRLAVSGERDFARWPAAPNDSGVLALYGSGAVWLVGSLVCYQE